MRREAYASNRDVVSLFSGAMGLDIGLKSAGLNLKICQDFDSACVETMRANGHNVISGDIRAIKPQEIMQEARLSVGEPFLVCGGPPCQPFSTAGKRLGISDPRGSLFVDFVRMIDYMKPRFFVMENVKGLMSAPLRSHPGSPLSGGEDGTALSVVLTEFKKLGYKTVCGILDSVNYGVAQFRERFVMIGSRDGEDIFLPVPTHFQFHQDSRYRWMTLKESIGDLEGCPGECASFGADRSTLLEMVPEGGNWRDLPVDVVEQAMGGAFGSGGGKVGFFRRLSYSQPAPTLLTSPVQKASILCHPTQNRPLSVSEYARIQQFPEDWVFSGTVAAKYRQIGNAVPIGLARAIGQALVCVADGTAEVKTKRVRGTDVHNRIKKAMELESYKNAN